MLDNDNQIKALLDRAKLEADKLYKETYAAARRDEEQITETAVSSMIILVLTRSALDHIATGLQAKLGIKNDFSPYFPISKTASAFQKKLDKDFPGLETKYPAFVDYIRSIQPFNKNLGSEAIEELNTLCNTAKHQRLLDISAFRERLSEEENPIQYHRLGRKRLNDVIRMSIEMATMVWLKSNPL